MKAIKLLFIVLIGMIFTTSIQASTPDLGKSSKTTVLQKQFVETVDTVVVNVSVQQEIANVIVYFILPEQTKKKKFPDKDTGYSLGEVAKNTNYNKDTHREQNLSLTIRSWSLKKPYFDTRQVRESLRC